MSFFARDPEALLWLDRVAQRYGKAPSDYLLGDPLRFWLDSAAARAGAWFDDKLNEYVGEGKDRRRRYTPEALIKMLQHGAKIISGEATPDAASAPGFADPSGLIALAGKFDNIRLRTED